MLPDNERTKVTNEALKADYSISAEDATMQAFKACKINAWLPLSEIEQLVEEVKEARKGN